MGNSLYVMDRIFANDLRCGETVVLTYEAHFPQFASNVTMPGLQAINTFYKRRALQWVRAVQMENYIPAISDMRDRKAISAPFSPHEFMMVFEVHYLYRGIISLFTDTYRFTGGAHGETTRTAETWDGKAGEAIPLPALFPPGTDVTALLTGAIAASIRTQMAKGEGLFYGDSPHLAKEMFSPENFFITPQALVLFYQQYQIAPYAAGIPTFEFPYGAVQARVPRCM